MTLYEISSQLHSLSVDGFFNHQKVTVCWLKDYIKENLIQKGKGSFLIEILLPDGWWHFVIHKFADGNRIGYDYTLPDTREQEAYIMNHFVEVAEIHT